MSNLNIDTDKLKSVIIDTLEFYKGYNGTVNEDSFEDVAYKVIREMGEEK